MYMSCYLKAAYICMCIYISIWICIHGYTCVHLSVCACTVLCLVESRVSEASNDGANPDMLTAPGALPDEVGMTQESASEHSSCRSCHLQEEDDDEEEEEACSPALVTAAVIHTGCVFFEVQTATDGQDIIVQDPAAIKPRGLFSCSPCWCGNSCRCLTYGKLSVL